MPKVGQHLVADLWGCPPRKPHDIMTILVDAARHANATILFEHYHMFPDSDDAFTGMIVLAESHISVHTWPEHDLIALDIFMCGSCDPYRAFLYVRDHLTPSRSFVKNFPRGTPEGL